MQGSKSVLLKPVFIMRSDLQLGMGSTIAGFRGLVLK